MRSAMRSSAAHAERYAERYAERHAERHAECHAKAPEGDEESQSMLHHGCIVHAGHDGDRSLPRTSAFGSTAG